MMTPVDRMRFGSFRGGVFGLALEDDAPITYAEACELARFQSIHDTHARRNHPIHVCVAVLRKELQDYE